MEPGSAVRFCYFQPFVPIAQWIEHWISNPIITVRFCVGTLIMDKESDKLKEEELTIEEKIYLDLLLNSKDLPAEIVGMVNENFWFLI